ncbi:MAG: hypothetical protein KAS86_04805, partial [Candidatus Omnitrophica bacterium]|nr:hypothetical protein [Candidatus Omnitrophota bacterium]
EIVDSIDRYKETLVDMADEGEVVNIPDAKGLYMLSRRISLRILELYDEALRLSRDNASDITMRLNAEQARSLTEGAFDLLAQIKKNTLRREGFDDNMDSFIDKSAVIDDIAGQLSNMSLAVSTMTGEGLRELISLKKMCLAAYNGFRTINDLADELTAENPGNTVMASNKAVIESYAGPLRSYVNTIDARIDDAMLNTGTACVYTLAVDHADLSQRVLSVVQSVTGGPEDMEYARVLAEEVVTDIFRSAVSSNRVFSDDFEFGTDDYWDEVFLCDSSQGVTSDPAGSGVVCGDYVLELRGNSSRVLKDLGDLTPAGTVTISFDGAVSSLESGEYLDLDFFDGTTWHNSVCRISNSRNGQGFTLKSWEAPDAYISENNKIRFISRASGSGDYCFVDNVVVSGTEREGLSREAIEGLKGQAALCGDSARQSIVSRIGSSGDRQELMALAASDMKAIDTARTIAAKGEDIETLITLSGVIEPIVKGISDLLPLSENDDDTAVLDGYIADSEEHIRVLLEDLLPGRVVINGDSIIARQFAVAAFLRDMEAKSELPSSEQGLKALKFTAGRLADIS